ncbi:MAG: DNA polymerase III subunit beta [Clostridia bacterium]|nr:DNA polymerase III subunit beta [Clostridia bacterium]
MKVIFDRQAILNATAPLLAATAGKSTLAATEGIKIEAISPDTCILTTYDLEKGMRTTIEAKVIEQGTFVVNAQKFNQTMRVMNGEEVTLTVDRNLCATIECGKSSHKMMALRGEDFPEIPRLESNLGFSVKAGVLKDMFTKVMYAMGVNDQRNVLNGCYIEVEQNKLLLVSCDSFKLAKCLLHTEIENNNADGSDIRFRFIVPVKTVNELYKLLGANADEQVRIHMMRKHMVFYFENLVFFSRLVDGEYIDFDRIIIRQHKIYIDLDREELLSALDRAALITEELVSGALTANVKLQLDGPVLKVLASSAAGSTYDEIDINHEGADLIIAFKNRYLTDSVRACESDRIRIALSSHLTSVNIEPIGEEGGDSEDLFMLLPVRMKD